MLLMYSKIPLAKPVTNTPVIHITNAIRIEFELRNSGIGCSFFSIKMAFITSK